MALDEDDIREILRLIDESDVEELRIEIEELSLHVVRGAPGPVDASPAVAAPAPRAADEGHVDTAPEAATDELLTIFAPMLGTFYRAEAPGAPPFVEVGTRVDAHTVVCLIEVMKMMNAVPAGVAGTVVAVCAENAQLVEYDAPLFRVQPDR